MRGNKLKGTYFLGPIVVGGKPMWITPETALWQSGSRIEHFVPHKYFLWAKEGVHIVTGLELKLMETKSL